MAAKSKLKSSKAMPPVRGGGGGGVGNPSAGPQVPGQSASMGRGGGRFGKGGPSGKVGTKTSVKPAKKL